MDAIYVRTFPGQGRFLGIRALPLKKRPRRENFGVFSPILETAF